MKIRIKQIVWKNKDVKIETPYDLTKIVNLFLQSGMKVKSIKGKYLDTSQAEAEIESIEFGWNSPT